MTLEQQLLLAMRRQWDAELAATNALANVSVAMESHRFALNLNLARSTMRLVRRCLPAKCNASS